MHYEELRRRIEKHLGLAQKRERLIRATDSGRLSPGEVAAHDQEIADLTRQCSQFTVFLNKLTAENDPALAKFNRELNAAMQDRAAMSGEEPTSYFQKIRAFVGTVSLVVLGVQMVDHWRHGSRN
jgi:hypothetical protein